MVSRNVAAMIHRHKALQKQPVWINKTTSRVCHSDRSVSGVEESTTLENEPTQGKTCCLGRFLDSLCSLGMTCRGVVSFNHTGYHCNVAGGRLPPLRTHRGVVSCICTGYIRNVPGTAHRPFPTSFSGWVKMNNALHSNNCQLSIVNCQFSSRSLQFR